MNEDFKNYDKSTGSSPRLPAATDSSLLVPAVTDSSLLVPAEHGEQTHNIANIMATKENLGPMS